MHVIRIACEIFPFDLSSRRVHGGVQILLPPISRYGRRPRCYRPAGLVALAVLLPPHLRPVDAHIEILLSPVAGATLSPAADHAASISARRIAHPLRFRMNAGAQSDRAVRPASADRATGARTARQFLRE